MKKLFLAAIAGAIVMSGILALLPAQTRTQPTQAAPASEYSHGDCQYPNRWSNPPNGCDNSDPAVPECVGKFSTQAQEQKCIAAFVKAHEEPAKPVKQTPAPKPTVTQCGGK